MFNIKSIVLCILLIVFGTGAFVCEASEDGDTSDNISTNEAYEKIYETLGIDRLDKTLNNEGLDSITVRGIINAATKGESKGILNYLSNGIKKSLIGEIEGNKQLMLSLIIIALFGAVFANLSGSFGQGIISENGFYVTYLIMTSITLVSFSMTFIIAEDAIKSILSLVKIILPFFTLSLAYIGKLSSSAGMYEAVMIGIFLVELIILKIIMPLIKFYVYISMINNLTRDDSFSKMCGLIKGFTKKVLKSIIMLVAGLNIIKGMVEPQIDVAGEKTVNKVIQAMPGGSVLSLLTGTFLGAGLIVKNCIGVVGIIAMLCLVLTPVIKIMVIMLMLRITLALLEPIGDKRYIKGLEAISDGMELLMCSVACSAALFMLTIAIVCICGGV